MSRIIEKVETHRRGYGSMTTALFRSEEGPSWYHGWDYAEIIYRTRSDYQRSACALNCRDAERFIGLDLDTDEIPAQFQVLGGKWHRVEINERGHITSLSG